MRIPMNNRPPVRCKDNCQISAADITDLVPEISELELVGASAVGRSEPTSIDDILADQPIEVMERLAGRYFTPSALLRRRLAERDAAIRALADASRGSGRELARAIHRELNRYAGGRFKFERENPPADRRRAALHRALTLNGGKVLGEEALRRVLAGLRVGKTLRRP